MHKTFGWIAGNDEKIEASRYRASNGRKKYWRSIRQNSLSAMIELSIAFRVKEVISIFPSEKWIRLEQAFELAFMRFYF